MLMTLSHLFFLSIFPRRRVPLTPLVTSLSGSSADVQDAGQIELTFVYEYNNVV